MLFLIAIVAIAGHARPLDKVLVRRSTPGPRFVEGEVLVRYKEGVSEDDIRAHWTRHGRRSVRSFAPHERGTHRSWRLRLAKGENVEDSLRDLSADPLVASAQPNYIYHLHTTPTDTLYSYQWSARNTAQTVDGSGFAGPGFAISEANPGSSGKDAGLEQAWTRVTDCSSVVIAVVDSGVLYTHTDLTANMWDGSGSGFPNHGYNIVAGTDDPLDDNGHGTHVAGTIGAVGNNGSGVAGVCWQAKIMAVKVMDATGAGTSADISSGIDWAVAHGAKIINMSLGGATDDPAMLTSLNNALASNVIVIVSAGNDGVNHDDTGTTQHKYPCDYHLANMLCVAAVGQTFGLASFSDYSATTVDVAAPGVNILSLGLYVQHELTATLTSAGGWTKSTTTSPGWSFSSVNYSGSPHPMMRTANWNFSAQYPANTDDKTSLTFDTRDAGDMWLHYAYNFNLATGSSVALVAKGGATDPGVPFSGGTTITTYTGNTDSSMYYDYQFLPNCIRKYCGIGFRLRSGSSRSVGGFISEFGITKFVDSVSGYNVESGTSMASPHVTGIAAMVWAANPTFTVARVLEAIKGGGVAASSLSGKTITGKIAHAAGALSYISAPTGVSAVAGP